MEYLKNNFNFNYIAPFDARNTKFNSNHFDFVTSSVTFEHVPEPDLTLILNETYRILKQGGILLLTIDYQDHWSYFDNSISIYNFLTYSDKAWEKYNPSLHYQNRLRHKDYLNIISKTNFKIIEEVPELPSEKEIKILENLNINIKYKDYSMNELSIKSSQIVLKK
jgi:ubiquinone/menaquinone biosynthesis C-methylase UbiE